MMMMNFLKKNRSVKKWREKALMIDPHKTRITILSPKRNRHLPIWLYKEFAQGK